MKSRAEQVFSNPRIQRFIEEDAAKERGEPKLLTKAELVAALKGLGYMDKDQGNQEVAEKLATQRILANPRVKRAFEDAAQRLRESGGRLEPATDEELQAVEDALDQ